MRFDFLQKLFLTSNAKKEKKAFELLENVCSLRAHKLAEYSNMFAQKGYYWRNVFDYNGNSCKSFNNVIAMMEL